jgi:hypothetical protein
VTRSVVCVSIGGQRYRGRAAGAHWWAGWSAMT